MRNDRKLKMAGLSIAMTMSALLPSEPSLAQVGMATPPAMGTTSPLTTVAPTGIPLGAVELNPGGLSSPMSISPTTPGALPTFSAGGVGCPSGTSSASGMNTLTSTFSNFDGGGVTGSTSTTGTAFLGGTAPANSTLSTVLEGCPPTTSSMSSSGALATPSMATRSSSARVGIPLGSDEISNLGVSPILGLPTTFTLDPVTSPLVALPTPNPLTSVTTSVTLSTPCFGSNSSSTDLTGTSSTTSTFGSTTSAFGSTSSTPGC